MLRLLVMLGSAAAASDAIGSNRSVAASDMIGYYSWNWGAGSTGPAGATVGVAFTGLIDVDTAIAYYTPGAAWCCPAWPAGVTPYITLGGGNSAGVFDVAALAAIDDTAAQKILAANYSGVVFDVEEVSGSADEIVPAFSAAFAACKAAGLTVVVTTSHSAPYACDSTSDAIAFVKAWAADENIDVLSPQLYSSGSEGAPEFAETSSCADAGCTWDLYVGAHAAFVPSIVVDTQYDEVTSWFESNYGIATAGFIQWAQVV